jgi:hypothetical protein
MLLAVLATVLLGIAALANSAAGAITRAIVEGDGSTYP